jgi:hypothetical protein
MEWTLAASIPAGNQQKKQQLLVGGFSLPL